MTPVDGIGRHPFSGAVGGFHRQTHQRQYFGNGSPALYIQSFETQPFFDSTSTAR
jgi:hypothetical protein